MTRRTFSRLVLLGSIGTDACAEQDSSVAEQVKAMGLKYSLGIIENGTSITTFDGRPPCQLRFPTQAYVAISPDGNIVVWYPHPETYPPPQQARIFWNDDSMQSGGTTIPGYPTLLAASSAPLRIACVLVGRGGFEFLLLDPKTGRQNDRTALTAGVDLAHLQRLCLSSTGGRVLFGSEKEFWVIDLAHNEVLLHANGEAPSLSPDGQRVAFVSAHHLMTQDIAATSAREINTQMRIEFAGGWSPNGQFILAGGRSLVDLSGYRLIVIEEATGRFSDIVKYPDEIWPSQYWIHTRFCAS